MRLTGSRTYYRPSPPKMPSGLVELMEGLTKEVLKHNPSEIYAFCANHMEQLLEKRDGPSIKKSLSLEEKIARAQEKVRQRAALRKQQFDEKIILQDQLANQDEINNDAMLSVPQAVTVDNSNEVNVESNENTLDLSFEEQAAKNFLKSPIHHEHALEKSSEVEICQESSLDASIQDREHDDVYSTEHESNDQSVDLPVIMTDGQTESVVTSNMDMDHVKETEKAVKEPLNSSFISVEQHPVNLRDKSDTKDFHVMGQEHSVTSISLQQNVGIDSEKVDEVELVNVGQDAAIIISEENSSHIADATVSLVDTSGIKDVNITEEKHSIPSVTQKQNPDQHVGNDNENVGKVSKNVINDDGIKIGEHIMSQIPESSKTKTDIQKSVDYGLYDTIDTEIVQIEQGEQLYKDNFNIQDEALKKENSPSNIENIDQQTDQNVKEVDENVVTFNVNDRVVDPIVVNHTHRDDNANTVKIDEKPLERNDNHIYQENLHTFEDNNTDTIFLEEKAIENIKVSANNPVVRESSAKDAPVGKSQNTVDDVHFDLDSTKSCTVMEQHTTDIELDSLIDTKAILSASDLPTQTVEDIINEGNQVKESINVTSASNDTKIPSEETTDNVSVILDEITSETTLPVDIQRNLDNSTDLLASFNTFTIHNSEGVGYDNDQNKTSVHMYDNKEGDNLQNTNMDLETAAITIQKVFRNFLFKSRGSTLEDTVNDGTIFLDEEISNKEDSDFSIDSAMNIDRRAHGITRMDTVLQTVNEEKSLSLSTDDSSTLSSAATTIQAHVRGFLVRNKLNSNKTNNSLVASNSNEPSVTSLDADNDQKSKTVLNIHIVPESGDYLSRDESFITSVDLSLDSPTSVNLHPSNNDKSERRRRLKREDAIQSVSPPSNNSGKLSDELDSVKEIAADHVVNDSNRIKKDDNINNEQDKIILSEESVVQTDENNKESAENIESNNEVKLNQKRKSLTKMNSDERDVVTPFLPNDDSGLIHSGEFHDAVVPTKVSRSDTSVVSGE